ncbi:hypothetical protein [Acinetobacter defluvii]|uniref:hypothetical protein n=1 Tax=Acinetobacter defluvii TaxID=1871111 RepID=UPI003AF648CE
MNYDQLNLDELLIEKETLNSNIENCKFNRRLIFENKGILYLLKKSNKLVCENGLTPEQANNELQQEIKKIQEEFLNIDLEQDHLYQKLNEVNIAIINKKSKPELSLE